MVNLLTWGVVFIHTCIISNSSSLFYSFSISLHGRNRRKKSKRKKESNSIHIIKSNYHAQSIQLFIIDWLLSKYNFFILLLPVCQSRWYAHWCRSDHRGENMCQKNETTMKTVKLTSVSSKTEQLTSKK